MTGPRPDDLLNRIQARRQAVAGGPSDPLLARIQARRQAVTQEITVEPVTVQGYYTTPEQLAERARSGDIAAALRLGTTQSNAPAQAQAARAMMPSVAGTTANIALSNVIAPVLPRTAAEATQQAIDRYVAGGGDAAQHADLFGVAAAAGDVGGNLLLGETLPVGQTLERGLGARELGRRILNNALVEGGTGAAMAGGGSLAEGASPREAAANALRGGIGQALLGGTLRAAPLVGTAAYRFLRDLGTEGTPVTFTDPVTGQTRTETVPNPLTPGRVAEARFGRAGQAEGALPSSASPLDVPPALRNLSPRPTRFNMNAGVSDIPAYLRTGENGMPPIVPPHFGEAPRPELATPGEWQRVHDRLMAQGAQTPPEPPATEPQIAVPVEPSLARSEVGSATTKAVTSLGGGTVGAAYGYATGQTPEERRNRALLFGLGGLATGYGVGKLAEGEPTPLNDQGFLALSRDAANDVSRGLRTQEAIERRAPKVSQSRTDFAVAPGPSPEATGERPYANLTKFGLVQEAEQRLAQEVNRIGPEVYGNPRRVVTHADIQQAASSLGLSDVLSTTTKNFTPTELLAARNLIADNTDRLVALDQRLSDPTLTQTERAPLALEQQALDTQNDLLLRKFLPAKTQAARNLNSLRIIANRNFDPAWWLAKATDIKGSPLSDMEAAILRKFLTEGDRAGLVQAVAGLRQATTGQKITTFWKANLLTNPVTSAVNTTSNAALTGLEVTKDIPASLIDRGLSLATARRTQTGPSFAQAKAAAQGAAEGLRQARLVMQGVPMAEDLAKYDIPRDVNFDNPVLDAYTKGVFRFLGAQDRVFRMAATRRALANQAEVLARTEGMQGEAFGNRVQYLISHPSTEMVMNAVAEAEQAVVQDRTSAGEALGALRRFKVGDVPVGEFAMPFTRTPGAVATRVGEYTFGMPYGVVKIANLARKGELANLTAPEQRHLAQLMGRGTTGVGLIAAGALLAKAGLLTTPDVDYSKERAQAQTDEMRGVQGTSLKLGDTQLGLGRLSIVGNLLGVGALAYKAASDNDPSTNPIAATALGGLKTVADQPFLQGISNIKDVTSDPGQFGAKVAGQVATGFVPASALVAGVARAMDPHLRQQNTLADQVTARLPRASMTLPLKYDGLGRPITRQTGLTGVLDQVILPTPIRTVKHGPVLDALGQYDVNVTGFTPKTGESEQDFARRAQASGALRVEELRAVLNSPAWYADPSHDARQELLKQALRRADTRIGQMNKATKAAR